MWKLISPCINSEDIDKLRKKVQPLHHKSEQRSFTSGGKKFFRTIDGLLTLRLLLNGLKDEINAFYEDAFIDHAFLLLKSPGGNPTPPHQDFIFWQSKELGANPKGFITFWLALQDIDLFNGALMLNPSERTEQISNLNNGTENLFSHDHSWSNNGEEFNRVCLNEDAISKLQPMPLRIGEWVAFDAYSLHASTQNLSKDPRLSLKIVVCESRYLSKKSRRMRVSDLTSSNKIYSYLYILACYLRYKIISARKHFILLVS